MNLPCSKPAPKHSQATSLKPAIAADGADRGRRHVHVADRRGAEPRLCERLSFGRGSAGIMAFHLAMSLPPPLVQARLLLPTSAAAGAAPRRASAERASPTRRVGPRLAPATAYPVPGTLYKHTVLPLAPSLQHDCLIYSRARAESRDIKYPHTLGARTGHGSHAAPPTPPRSRDAGVAAFFLGQRV